MNRFKPFRVENERRPLTTIGFATEAEHPSDMWRTIEPFEEAKRAGHDCWIVLQGHEVVHAPDIIVMRASFFDVRYARQFIASAEADSVLVVIDYDDNYHGIRDNDPIVNQIPETLRLAHLVTATTAQLADEIMRYSGRESVWVIPNAINVANWLDVKPPDPDLPIVTLVGSQSHETDWEIVPEVIRTLADRFPLLRFRIAGCEPAWLNDFAPLLGDRLERRPWVRFHDYPNLLEGSTLILAPLVDSLLNRGRSPIRFWEATCAGAAFIGSPLVYTGFVEDGITGYLTDDLAQTIDHASHLLSNEHERLKMVSLARQSVRNHRLEVDVVDARFDVYYAEWQARYGTSAEQSLRETGTNSIQGGRPGDGGRGANDSVNRFRPVLPRDSRHRRRPGVCQQPPGGGGAGARAPAGRAPASQLWTPPRPNDRHAGLTR